MLHDEKRISLQILANVLKDIYQLVDKLDSKVVELEKGKSKSIFIEDSKLYNRKAVSFAYDSLNSYIRYESRGEKPNLYLYSKPVENTIELLEVYQKLVDDYCDKNDELEFSITFTIRTHIFGQLCGYMNFLLNTSLSTCLKYETDLLLKLPVDKLKEEVKKRIKNIEREDFFYNEEHSIHLHSYATQKIRTLKFILEDIEEDKIDDKEIHLVKSIVEATKKLQSQKKNIEGNEKARTQMLSNLIKGFVAKDESGSGLSESGKSIGEPDIKLENNNGEIIAFCEGFNLKRSFDKTVIRNHVTKIFNYDASGLRTNFIFIFYELKDFLKDFNRYLHFIDELEITNLKLTNISEVDPYDLPAKIKIIEAIYELNLKSTKVVHLFIDMN